ncbi:hypothetical protein BHE18_12965 [Rossellomorea aquimaris]|uniref:Uncharacterized protein n=1 Tax=Rossellomorea aquimaris TaxID=189382 RepID=A0A1J6VR43_9BACI|nr:hypothetical protein BHE18_12965 [Rossellomorea aquimaris]
MCSWFEPFSQFNRRTLIKGETVFFTPPAGVFWHMYENGFTLKLFHKHANTKLILLKTGPKENMQEVLFFVNILS